MRIAITGHTSGIGKAIADGFPDATILGFSRSNGYDIGLPEARERILEAARDCDVFINNAYHIHGQIEMLHLFEEAWADDNSKTIITIGGISAMYPPFARHTPDYSQVKKALMDHHLTRLRYNTKYLMVGPVDGTDLARGFPGPKVPLEEIVYFIKQMIYNKNISMLTLTTDLKVMRDRGLE